MEMRVYLLRYPKHVVRLFLLASWMGNNAGFIGIFISSWLAFPFHQLLLWYYCLCELFSILYQYLELSVVGCYPSQRHRGCIVVVIFLVENNICRLKARTRLFKGDKFIDCTIVDINAHYILSYNPLLKWGWGIWSYLGYKCLANIAICSLTQMTTIGMLPHTEAM